MARVTPTLRLFPCFCLSNRDSDKSDPSCSEIRIAIFERKMISDSFDDFSRHINSSPSRVTKGIKLSQFNRTKFAWSKFVWRRRDWRLRGRAGHA